MNFILSENLYPRGTQAISGKFFLLTLREKVLHFKWQLLT